QEQLPLRFEGIVPGHIVRYLLPALEKIDGLRDVWIPYRLGRVDARLRQAAPQPCDRRPVRAVDLQSQQIIAPNAHTPRTVEVRDDAAFELQRRVGRIV